MCDVLPNSTLAYFYCDFQDSAKQNLRGLLLSLLLHLSPQLDHDYTALSALYSKHGDGAQQPSEDTLRTAVKDMLKLAVQGRTYIVIDAVDECPNTSLPDSRNKILRFIEELAALPTNIHICVTSRPESDIEDTLRSLASCRLALHTENGQMFDIEHYVKSIITSDHQFRRWREADRIYAIETLVQKADGM